MRNYLPYTAHDFDGDGNQEVAVQVTTDQRAKN
jgi:hypothetical protein